MIVRSEYLYYKFTVWVGIRDWEVAEKLRMQCDWERRKHKVYYLDNYFATYVNKEMPWYAYFNIGQKFSKIVKV
jgi:hypothetical protein